MPKNTPITAARIDSRPHVAGNLWVYPSYAKGITTMEDEEFLVAQLSAWPWLHAAE
jgi:hypothetical protein